MRVSIVPAQITTVEDKIVGNISVLQAMLLGAPILAGFVIALIFPPSGQFVGYKIAIVTVLFLIFGTLAIRIKDRIIAQWIKLLSIYCARPKLHLYNKNSSYLRISPVKQSTKSIEPISKAEIVHIKPSANISSKERARLENMAVSDSANMKFEVVKKGRLYVRFTETK